jgi:predicted neutral ceramidase superfamily lipid hydrolase
MPFGRVCVERESAREREREREREERERTLRVGHNRADHLYKGSLSGMEV